jgi:hypothetical protein
VARRSIVLLALIAATLSAGPVRAEALSSLAAVGMVKSRSGGGCSAALIDRDVVLTAAHCVDRKSTEGGNLVFLTGAYPGAPSIEVPVSGVAVHPLYDLNIEPETSRIRFDIALLRLARPVDEPWITPLPVGSAPEVGERLLLASYRGGRGERARERRCEVFPGPPELAALGCEVASGESGSPLMRLSPEGPVIVAVLSSRSRFDQQPIGFAAPVEMRIRPVLDLLPEAPPPGAAPDVEGTITTSTDP